MGRRYVERYFDDFDGTELTAEEITTVHFSIDGTAYSIDLSESNANAFRAVIEPYIQSAQVIGRRKGRRRREPNYTQADVRRWATEQGIEVASRGRLHNDVIRQFLAAHPSLNEDLY